MQEALTKLGNKVSTMPALQGVLADELGIGATTYLTPQIKSEWATYQADMIAASDPNDLRAVHAAFLQLEGL
jgi:hypothetical protein